jgi:hypothetical protein
LARSIADVWSKPTALSSCFVINGLYARLIRRQIEGAQQPLRAVGD